MDRWHRIVPWIVLGMAVLAVGAVIGDIPVPLRSALTLCFALLGPGLLVVRSARMGSLPAELAVAVAVSLAVDGLVATAALYAGRSSSDLVLAIIVWLTVPVALAQGIFFGAAREDEVGELT